MNGVMTEATGLAILAELRKINERTDRTLPEHPMTVAEFAKVVGKCQKTIWRWIDSGKLKVKREGRNVMISPLAARRFLQPEGEF